MTCIKKKEPDAIIELIWPAAKYTPEPSGFLETITFVVVNIIYSKKTKNKWQFRSLMICQWIHKGVSLLNLKSYKKERKKKVNDDSQGGLWATDGAAYHRAE